MLLLLATGSLLGISRDDDVKEEAPEAKATERPDVSDPMFDELVKNAIRNFESIELRRLDDPKRLRLT